MLDIYVLLLLHAVWCHQKLKSISRFFSKSKELSYLKVYVGLDSNETPNFSRANERQPAPHFTKINDNNYNET